MVQGKRSEASGFAQRQSAQGLILFLKSLPHMVSRFHPPQTFCTINHVSGLDHLVIRTTWVEKYHSLHANDDRSADQKLSTR